jgi:hypothetical protein
MKPRATDSGRNMCGFCMTGHHENCKPVIKHYDKEWYCYCETCHPDVVSDVDETKEEQEIENDEGKSPSEDKRPSESAD